MLKTAKWKPGLTLNRDPDEVEDYQFDFSEVVGSDDTLSSASIDDSTGVAATVANTETTGEVTVRVSGGTVGQDASVTVQATMASGRIQQRTVSFNITER